MQTLHPLRFRPVLTSVSTSSYVQKCLAACLPTFSRRWMSKREARRVGAQKQGENFRNIAKTSQRLLKRDTDNNNNNNDVIHNMGPDYSTSVGPVQNFRHFLVMDLEATCDHKSQGPFGPQEIIEFPALKVCSKTFRVEAKFHTFVRPTAHPILKPFCTQLTGVVQDDVDDAPTLSETLEQFHAWMIEERLVEKDIEEVKDFARKVPSSNFAVVTCGDWDLAQMLPDECARLGIDLPPYLTSWINVKTSFADSHGKWARGMQHLLDELKLPLHGRPHSGIDDCVNIKSILAAIAAKKRFVFRVTSTFKGASAARVNVASSLRSFAE